MFFIEVPRTLFGVSSPIFLVSAKKISHIYLSNEAVERGCVRKKSEIRPNDKMKVYRNKRRKGTEIGTI